MSDTALPVIFHYGTNAARLAFTPSPAAGVNQLYIWYESDTNTTWAYTTAWHQISSTGVGVTASGTLTANQLVIGGGGSVVSALGSLGTTTTLLHGNAGGAPSFAAVSLSADVTGTLAGTKGGGLVLLEQHTASNSASLDFTTAITSTYDEYLFELVSLVPVSNSDLKMLVSTDGGGTWDTSNVYRWQNLSAWSAGTGQNSGGTATSWLLRGSNTTLISGASYNGTLRLFNPLSASLNKLMKGSLPIDDNTLGLVIFEWLGTWRTATAVNALQFLMASGNITSGTVRCYGLSKS